MNKLPFLTAPIPETVVLGDRLTGTLSIRKLGDLTPNERIYIKEETIHLPDLRTEAVRMAKVIASSKSISLTEAYAALIQSDVIVLSEHLDQILALQDIIEKNGQIRTLALVTAIIRSRLTREWTMADTQALVESQPRLVTLIAEFANKEETGWEVVEPVPETEESLKKPSMESKNPTGEDTIGNAQVDSPTIPDSVPIILETSPVG